MIFVIKIENIITLLIYGMSSSKVQ